VLWPIKARQHVPKGSYSFLGALALKAKPRSPTARLVRPKCVSESAVTCSCVCPYDEEKRTLCAFVKRADISDTAPADG